MAVHPRLRGELGTPLGPVKQGAGSSPLARGTQCAYEFDKMLRRFIPACAGNSLKDGTKPSIHTLAFNRNF